MRDLINSELLDFVSLAEDAELLHGDGTRAILGMIPQATAFSAPFTVTSPTGIDTIGSGLLQCALADFPPDGIVLHPSDWMRIRLLKSSAGEYLYGTPGADEPAPRLFGLPVAVTPAMTVDKFLIGNFQAAATLYDRWSPRVEISTEHSDFFIKNLVCILAEERVGLAVKQPGALIFGDFGNVA